jgi:hypothetical protein
MKEIYISKLKCENLSRLSVLSQAWKKVNHYIRRDNWYTDYLELDKISLDLESNLIRWSQLDLINNNLNSEVEIIPVPKNAKWEINTSNDESIVDKFNAWRSTPIMEDNKQQELTTRNISNVPMESQVLAMSLLMNIAEIVENQQKKIISNSLTASNKRIYSYGNRLDCYWEKRDDEFEAYFKTGSIKTYENYFNNYQLFIKRPEEICKYYYDGLDLYKELYIISFDLKDFYDSINLNLLYEKLEGIVKNYVSNYELSNFLKSIKNILSWKTGVNKTFNGLPQGLAASGFFANAFLIDFDEAIGSMIDKQLEKTNGTIIIRDYCRYVDDLRFVVEVDRNISKDIIQTEIEKFMNSVIDKHYHKDCLKLNNEKSNVINYIDIINKPISKELTTRRTLISGAPSVEELLENIDALKSLLNKQPYYLGKNDTVDSFGLNSILKNNTNLKDETIKRFVATDLKKSLKLKDSFSITEISQESKFNVGDIPLSNSDKDISARLLIFEWLKNPSLIYLLKCALEIHASTELIKPILNIILYKIENYNLVKNKTKSNDANNTLDSEFHYMLYISSQILFYSATKIHSIQKDDYNIERIKSYKESITCFAEKIIKLQTETENEIDIPWYTLQGAIFYLVSTNHKIPKINLNLNNKLENYHFLATVSEYEIPERLNGNTTEILCFALINQQMNKNNHKFASWFNKLIKKIREENIENIEETNSVIQHLVHLLFIYDKELFEYVFRTKNLCHDNLNYGYPYVKYFEVSKDRIFELKNNQEISFLKVISSKMNPFIYENPLLLLLDNLLKKDHYLSLKEGVSLHDITVKCEDWSEIQNPKNYSNKNFFRVDIKKGEKLFPSKNENETNLLEEFPFWLKDRHNFKVWLKTEMLEYFNKKDDIEYALLIKKELTELTDELDLKWEKEFRSFNDELKVLYSIGKILRSSLIGDYDYTLSKFLQRKESNYYTGVLSTIFSRSFGFNISLNTLTNGEQPISPWLSDVIFNTLRWPYAFRAPSKNGFFNLKGLLKQVKEKILFQKSIFGDVSNLPLYTYPVENINLVNKESVRIASVQTMMPFVEDFDSKNPLYWSINYRNKHRKHLINLCNLINKHLKAQNINNDQELNVDIIVFPELSIHIDDLDILVRLSKLTKASIFAGLTFVEHPIIKGKIINRAVWLLNEIIDDEVRITKVYQGKENVTKGESKWGITGYRPYQLVIDFKLKNNVSWKVSGAICYDSTDLKLAADLTGITDTFIVAAMNKDIQTFDTMATALSYHMYQPVIIVNTGEFGGSTVQAPYSGHDKLIAHIHGSKQLGLSIFDVSPSDFKNKEEAKIPKKRKTPPAEYPGRPLF